MKTQARRYQAAIATVGGSAHFNPATKCVKADEGEWYAAQQKDPKIEHYRFVGMTEYEDVIGIMEMEPSDDQVGVKRSGGRNTRRGKKVEEKGEVAD